MQSFKGDATELKFDSAGAPVLSNISLQLDLFLAGAFDTEVLGDMISVSNRSPLATAIKQSIFRTTFKELFDAFVKVGTFEAYLTVFRKIFGDDVDVEFTVPAPGRLQITVTASGLEESDLLSRRIVSGAYVFDELIDSGGDNIAVQTVKGFETQYELEQMLFEMVPGGIYTEITLTVG